MRLSTPLEFPGSRYVAGWWKQLAPLRPRQLWVGHLLFHQVEAPVQTAQTVTLDRFTRLLLCSLHTPRTVAQLADRLCVAPTVADRLVEELRRDGLTIPGGQGLWSASPRGQQTLAEGHYFRLGHERRLFHFLTSTSGQAPEFLRGPERLLPPPADLTEWHFEPAWLQACVARPREWKEQRQFPLDIEAVGTEVAFPAGAPAWQSVLVDRPGYLVAALVLAPAESGERLLAFPVDPESWAMPAREAAFIAAGDPRGVLPDLADPPPAAWREAWLAWCQRRGLPTVEAEQTEVEKSEQAVRVRIPQRLHDRLRSSRSEALKGEAWLLAGTGRVRMAAPVEVVTP